MNSKGKVLVAMSGGIDSTVAALLLHEQGYEVIGITMKTWDYATATGSSGKKETGCCNLDAFNDARQAAVDHGFPHYVIDIRDEFGSFVVENFVDEYMAGRTPNPCVLCNTHIKWAALLKRADALGCDFIATGHYARVRAENGRWILSKAHDLTKDQSYVLWGLPQEVLKRTLFPLGDFLKTDVRQMAADRGYIELSKKAESFEICFVPDNDYRGFLKRTVAGLEEKVAGGDYVLTDGRVVGKHKGYPFYTIGQRKGLDLALGRPVFVTAIHPETNTVVLGEADDLKSVDMRVKGINWIKWTGVQDGQPSTIKIRYKDPGTSGFLQLDPQVPEGALVHFDHAVSGIAPGQSAVFYDGDDVIGGGIIQHL
ncbi:MAG: tRNA 2-thiouridine(34) synthase MnmA [Sphingobacteriales bacterium]|nr:MAG: tRNA 2-thiouridine(34) synthase MnmA [Sphingobacteriales bacterium]